MSQTLLVSTLPHTTPQHCVTQCTQGGWLSAGRDSTPVSVTSLAFSLSYSLHSTLRLLTWVEGNKRQISRQNVVCTQFINRTSLEDLGAATCKLVVFLEALQKFFGILLEVL